MDEELYYAPWFEDVIIEGEDKRTPSYVDNLGRKHYIVNAAANPRLSNLARGQILQARDLEAQYGADIMRLGIGDAVPFAAGILGGAALPSVGPYLSGGVGYLLNGIGKLMTPSTWINNSITRKIFPRLPLSTIGTAADTGATLGYGITAGKDIINRTSNLINGKLQFSGDDALGYGMDALGVIGGTNSAKLVKRAANNVERRAIETALRSTYAPNPLNTIKESIAEMRTEDPKRLKGIFKYIFTGKGLRGIHNTLGFVDDYNTGFVPGTGPSPSLLENDLIDAFLYGKTISPEYGVYKTNSRDYGIHSKYINKHYANKDIPIYEQLNRFGNPRSESQYYTTYGAASRNNYDDFINGAYPTVDALGHLVEFGIGNSDNLLYKRYLDIWKFNPEDYLLKYDYTMSNKPLRRLIERFGLHEVDKLGTPIITRTPWKPDINIKI